MTTEKNYQDYTFKSEEEVVISGEFMNELLKFLNMVKDKETKVFFNKQVNTAEEFFNQTPRVEVTEAGFMSEVMLQNLYTFHVLNVDNGKGILKSELEKPQLELVKP
jgi:hypothetical protein